MTSYHMVFKNGYFGSINKCGGLPTHLPEIWPQIDGADLAFLFQLYCDGEKLNKIGRASCRERVSSPV